MCEKKTFTFHRFMMLFGFASLILSLFTAIPAHAGSLSQDVDNGTCIDCHEDLYFLHDMGKWFCIRESPMPCVACHGGNPMATMQETAHYDLSPHPVLNENITKCQECHPEECNERVGIFGEVAGIKEVKLVSPAPFSSAPDSTISLPATKEREPVNWPLVFEILPLVVITSLAMTIYILRKVRNP